jgi:hypothetical protein
MRTFCPDRAHSSDSHCQTATCTSSPSPRVRGEGRDEGAYPQSSDSRQRPLTRRAEPVIGPAPLAPTSPHTRGEENGLTDLRLTLGRKKKGSGPPAGAFDMSHASGRGACHEARGTRPFYLKFYAIPRRGFNASSIMSRSLSEIGYRQRIFTCNSANDFRCITIAFLWSLSKPACAAAAPAVSANAATASSASPARERDGSPLRTKASPDRPRRPTATSPRASA